MAVFSPAAEVVSAALPGLLAVLEAFAEEAVDVFVLALLSAGFEHPIRDVAISAASASEVTSTTKALTPYKGWPNDGGFLGGYSKTETAKTGQVFSRIGELNGSYTAPKGTSLSQRGLPSSYANQTETLWKVEKAFNYKGGIAAPWKDATGGGIQYKLPDTIENLWKNGYISPVE